MRNLIFFCFLPLCSAATPYPLQQPSLSKDRIVFTYAGDLWTVPRAGGEATRLTTGIGIERDPVFSPDGSTIAFSGDYDGNLDVYTIPSTGGIPKRITFHPARDSAVAWTPDSSHIVFASSRDSQAGEPRLYMVPAMGGLARAMPLPVALSGSLSPDGRRLAYPSTTRNGGFFDFYNYVAWKRYRGGKSSYLNIVDLKTLDSEKIPRKDSNDFNPMWVGDNVYFLSDRDGPVTLYRYDAARKSVTQLVRNNGFDIRSASAGPGGIVYDQFGELFLYDLSSEKSRRIDVSITGDMPEVRPHFGDVSRELRNARISPSGVRAVFEAHGEILTVPISHGEARNLTNTPGVMEREPSWNPGGEKIAYFSDESGEYALHVRSQSGDGEVRKYPLAGGSAYYLEAKWSPDSKLICFFDNKLNIWYLDTESGRLTKVDANMQSGADREMAWSPDSKWIAYTKSLPNLLGQIRLYSIGNGQSTAVTDGMSDAHFPAFDKDGRYLYFLASTDDGGRASGSDMSQQVYQPTSSVYAAVLSADGDSPVKPDSDEEKAPAPKPAAAGGASPQPVAVHIDLANLQDRIVALPIPAQNYDGLQTGKAGKLYLIDRGSGSPDSSGGSSVTMFDVKTRKTERLGEGVRSIEVSFDGEKMLVEFGGSPGAAQTTGPRYAIVSATTPWKPGDGVLRLSGLQVKVDPRAEWKQMYHEVWRIQRSYFYDEHFHGLDISAREKLFEPYLDSIASRADLNYLFQEMLGDITVSHLRGSGGTIPTGVRVPGGLLGADYEIVDGHYRIARIYSGERWNPQIHAPLAQPGLTVAAGDFILAVNGQDLLATDDISRMLENTAGKTVILKVASDAAGTNAHQISVVPVASESTLRKQSWVEDNRRKVDELSGGKLAYVYVPDTATPGFTSFNRYFFAQTDKLGLVLDERFNTGGWAPDYIIDLLQRPLLNYFAPRYGEIWREPHGAIFGPKVMITNEYAGSGGDSLPWFFRRAKLGTLVGMRTWGGLVGISGTPQLMDGASVTSPTVGVFSPRRRVGGGEPRRGSGHNGGNGPEAGGARPRPTTGTGGCRGNGATGKESARRAEKTKVSGLPPDV